MSMPYGSVVRSISAIIVGFLLLVAVWSGGRICIEGGMLSMLIFAVCVPILPLRSVADIVNVDYVSKWNNILVLIAGGGDYLDELKKLVVELDLCEHVKFIGKVSHEEIKNYYAMSDVVVVPSLIKESLSRSNWNSKA